MSFVGRTKRKVFDDFGELEKISEVIGFKKTTEIVNENIYLKGRDLTSSDVEMIYDSRYFAALEAMPARRIINEFKLNYYCLFAFEILEKKYPVKGKKILDVGCGNGNLCLALASIGYDVKGIDFSKESIANAESKRSRAVVLSGRADFEVSDIDSISECYDYVIFSDVVEHLSVTELDLILLSVRKKLKNKGGLVIHTPNGRVRHHRLKDDYLFFSFVQKIYQGFRWFKDKVVKARVSEQDLLDAYYSQTHINVMTPKQIKRLLEFNGYNKIQWFYRQDRYFPLTSVLSFFGFSTDVGVFAQVKGENIDN